MAVNIGAISVQVSVTVAIVRGVIVTPSKTDNRGRTRAIRIAVNAAIVRRSRSTAAPAAPGGFGRNIIEGMTVIKHRKYRSKETTAVYSNRTSVLPRRSWLN